MPCVHFEITVNGIEDCTTYDHRHTAARALTPNGAVVRVVLMQRVRRLRVSDTKHATQSAILLPRSYLMPAVTMGTTTVFCLRSAF